MVKAWRLYNIISFVFIYFGTVLLVFTFINFIIINFWPHSYLTQLLTWNPNWDKLETYEQD